MMECACEQGKYAGGRACTHGLSPMGPVGSVHTRLLTWPLPVCTHIIPGLVQGAVGPKGAGKSGTWVQTGGSDGSNSSSAGSSLRTKGPSNLRDLFFIAFIERLLCVRSCI